MKLSFHNHSEYSWDCRTSLSDLERLCEERGIEAITITDHNEIRGAQLAAEQFKSVKVIIGEEINTAEGEVVGIFLTRKINPGLSLEETLSEIHRQNGLAVVVHPFDRLRRHVMNTDALIRHLADIDIIEVYNSRTVFPQDNVKASIFARQHAKPVIAGNDAHTPAEVGLSTVDVPTFTDAKSFLINLQSATLHTRQAPIWVHAITKLVKWETQIKRKMARQRDLHE